LCRDRRDELIALVALVAKCWVERAAQHLRHSTYDFFLYHNAWAR